MSARRNRRPRLITRVPVHSARFPLWWGEGAATGGLGVSDLSEFDGGEGAYDVFRSPETTKARALRISPRFP
jgi:hypothetical protein